ncbi:MAG: pyruvate:ferredoxin (flavodoxin) oxidoreductase [Myxococcota bacterium]
MVARRKITIDGNEAAASVAHRTNEVIAIYPITPSSSMGELSDEWSANGRKNIWGSVPQVTEMQSEGGAAGAVHGALQAGALTTTFTASQGLLLMIPNMYKIAGELTPFVMHVAARTLATHALSIFGDHSDVMACRQTGFAMLCGGSVQEAHDFALITQAATLRARIPFLHFFDGFRTSHEVAKMEELTDDDLRHMMDDTLLAEHRKRGLSPDRPNVRGTAQNPDTFFQAREACNKYYDAVPAIVQAEMDKFAALAGRAYKLFDYVGHPQAEWVLVLMGSGAETTHETVDWMVAQGEKVGVVKVRLYRPFSLEALAKALPKTTLAIAVLDRTKEPGAVGEPLYQDVLTALSELRAAGESPFAAEPKVVGGRYGLSSKEFTPAMIKSVFDELKNAKPRNHFTVGIVDDVTHLSLPLGPALPTAHAGEIGAVFFGVGADGTVGANKNSIKIIGEETPNYAQGYFVYDSKKSGTMTTSHLRFGPKPIRSAYLVKQAQFVACHQFTFLDKVDMLDVAAPGATFLLNSVYGAEEVWDHLPKEVQHSIIEKGLKFFVIDGFKVARDTGMGQRINTIMQTCFFAISGVLPRDEAIAQIKYSVKKTYAKKGDEIVQKNYEAIDHTLAHLFAVRVPAKVTATRAMPPIVSDNAPDFVKRVTSVMMADKGDLLPVSAFPPDGVWPTGTTKWEKRNIALDIPTWDESICIQCNKCALICPHAAIRVKAYDPKHLDNAPLTFKSLDYKSPEFKGAKYTVQVAPEDCTGCGLCVEMCPAKDKKNPEHKSLEMVPQLPLRDTERENWDFFLNLPDPERTEVKIDVKGSQFLVPLFEYSGACSGCGETPYIKLLTQLFGDRMLIANATGCSSIYGANLPTTPYTCDTNGRGPAWANSLFEDNAEFGVGMRLAVDRHVEQAEMLLLKLAAQIGSELVSDLLKADQTTEAGVKAQRERVEVLRQKLTGIQGADARMLELQAEYFERKIVWIVGGDGWAYDIGYGGLDHVLSMGRNVNILVLDTEVYSNTGGQASKATPMGAAAKFATAGKPNGKKDLGLIAMSYGNVYVARVAIGARDAQTVRALQEAEAYDGPSLVIAYSHCIAHGYDLQRGLDQQKTAVNTGYWPLYRYDPRRVLQGESAMKLDSAAPKQRLMDFVDKETRYKMVQARDPERFERLISTAENDLANRYALYEHMAKMAIPVQLPVKTEE